IGWSLGALWQASFVGLGNMLGGVVLVEGRTLYLTDVIGPIGYDKIFHFAAAAGLSLLAWEAVEGIAGPGARRGITGLAMVVWLRAAGPPRRARPRRPPRRPARAGGARAPAPPPRAARRRAPRLPPPPRARAVPPPPPPPPRPPLRAPRPGGGGLCTIGVVA